MTMGIFLIKNFSDSTYSVTDRNFSALSTIAVMWSNFTESKVTFLKFNKGILCNVESYKSEYLYSAFEWGTWFFDWIKGLVLFVEGSYRQVLHIRTKLT